jgi:hypothetical protein
MHHYDQRWPRWRAPSPVEARFAVGERVCIVGAPESYGYNGCVGTIVAIDGVQIHVQVDDPPGDMTCTTFYREELTHAPDVPSAE